MPITTTGLIQFVLANASPRVRIQASFQLCSDSSCLLHSLSFYSSQSRRALRTLSHLKITLHEINMYIIWKRDYRHDKHEKEVTSFLHHIKTKYAHTRRRSNRLSLLLHLLKTRIIRHQNGLQSEVTQDFVDDMLTVIQERQLTVVKPSVKKSKKKAKQKKTRNQPKDEL